MTARGWCLFLASILLFSGPAQAADEVQINLRADGSAYMVGRAIPILLTATNTGSKDITYTGYVYDTSGYSAPYTLSAADASGKTLSNAGANSLGNYDGMVVECRLRPGEKLERTLELNKFADIGKPGTFSVQGQWRFENGSPPRSSNPLVIKVAAAEQTSGYLAPLLKQLQAITAESKSNHEAFLKREDLIQQIAMTRDPSVIQPLLAAMYVEPKSFWICEGLTRYFPAATVAAAVVPLAKQRGLASNMGALLYRLQAASKDAITENDWAAIITRSLAPDNPQRWYDGSLAAAQHANAAFVPRLIAIAESQNQFARTTAIYSLASIKTAASERELQKLLKSPDIFVRSAAQQALGNAKHRLPQNK